MIRLFGPRECPVCWRLVRETARSHAIEGHRDGGGTFCPGSHQPFWITQPTQREMSA